MANTFNAKDAQGISTGAREKLKTLEKFEREIRKNWLNQMNKILFNAAAELESMEASCVYEPKRLLELSFLIDEIGSFGAAEEVALSDEFESRVTDCFNRFWTAARGDIEKYYSGVEDCRLQHFQAFRRAVESDFKALGEYPKFEGDYVYKEVVPMRIRSKYQRELAAINAALKLYRLSLNGERVEADFEKQQSPNSIFSYSSSHDLPDVLLPKSPGNIMSISWRHIGNITDPFSDLFSAEGMSWLAGYHGQTLLSEIFSSLREEAEEGNLSAMLKFEKRESSWTFMRKTNFSCCDPVELIPLIAKEGFKVQTTQQSDVKISLKVSW